MVSAYLDAAGSATTSAVRQRKTFIGEGLNVPVGHTADRTLASGEKPISRIGPSNVPRAISCSPVATSHGLSVRSLAASGFSAVGTESLDGSPGPGWKASPRCGPYGRPNRTPAGCHRG
jgi:hypothetical protein